MQREERARRQKLDTALSKFDAFERRTLADLADYGFHFGSIESARRMQRRLRAIDRFDREGDVGQLVEAFRDTTRARRKA